MVRPLRSIITIIVGEGASGGALGIGVGEIVYMKTSTMLFLDHAHLFYGKVGSTKNKLQRL
jgi:hypothetical protein